MSLRIGVLGAARIVKGALLAPSRTVDDVEVSAIAARDPERAAKYAARHGIPRVHRSYEELLNDPSLDAVYVPLPAARHAEWTIAAIEAGKHVLCEKPFTSNTASASLVAGVAASSDRVVMEAYHSHYHPFQQRMREIVESELGPVTAARAIFGVPIPPGRDIRWNLALGGGGLLDVGYYPVRLLRELFGDAPTVTAAHAKERGGIDRLLTATLRFDSGVRAEVVSSIWSRRLLVSRLEVTGVRGSLRVSWPYHPQMRCKATIRTAAGKRVELPDKKPSYAYQLEAFRNGVLTGAPVPTDAPAAVAQMHTLDAIYLAAGMSVRPGEARPGEARPGEARPGEARP